MLNLYLFYLFFFLPKTTISIIKIPFEKKIETNLITSEYLCKNIIKSNIIIGSSNEEVPIIFDLSSQNILIPDSSFEFINYNENKSYSFKFSSEEKKICYFNKNKFDCYQSLESFYFLNKQSKKEKISSFPFLLLRKSKNEKNEISYGKIGLKAKSNNNSLISQLKQKKFIEKYIFSISYFTETKGEIIIGNYPHEYNKNYNEKNFYFLPIESPKINSDWIIVFDYISYLDKKESNKRVIFNFNFGGILTSIHYQKFLNQSFFKDYYLNKLCTLNFFVYDENDYEDYQIKYSQIICDKSINLTNFPPLIFVKKDYNITLNFTFQDLFRIYNEKYYLMIYFSFDQIYEWIIGEPFFWKFETVFDTDKAIIGFYNKIKNEKQNFNFIYIIIIIILGILIIILSILLYLNISNKQRKKRAYELDDDYLYIENSNMKNGCF